MNPPRTAQDGYCDGQRQGQVTKIIPQIVSRVLAHALGFAPKYLAALFGSKLALSHPVFRRRDSLQRSVFLRVPCRFHCASLALIKAEIAAAVGLPSRSNCESRKCHVHCPDEGAGAIIAPSSCGAGSPLEGER
jgi:hypothetical protein